MMKKIFSFALIVCSTLSLFAQNNAVLDSLLKEADKNLPDSIRIGTLYDIGDMYVDNNASKAIGYYEQVNDLAKKLNDTLIIANSDYSLGFAYLLQANFEKSLQHYLLAARNYELRKDNRRLANAYMSVGNVYFDNNAIAKAGEYYRRAENIAIRINDSMKLAQVYSSWGNAYDKSKKYDSALIYLNKAYPIFISKGDLFDKVNIYTNLGLTYKHTNRTTEALRYFEDIKEMIKGEDLPRDILAIIYNNLGSTYSQAKLFDKAQPAFDTSIMYAKDAHAMQVLMENYNNISDMYRAMGNPEKEANFLRQYYQLKDSLFSADSKNELTQLEADYQLEKKNAELVKKDAEVIKRESQRNIFLIIALAAAVLLAGVAYFYNRIRRKNNKLSEQNITIHQQNTQLQTLNSVKDRLFSIISHDLRNPLVTLQSYLSLSGRKDLAEEKKEQYRIQTTNAVTQTSHMLDNLLAWANMQIKNTRASITPVDVDELVSDTKSGAEAQAAQKQIVIHEDLAITTIPGDYNILSIALRNLLTNAIKFSDKQGNIWINAEKKDGNILLSVKDEGVGMTEGQIKEMQSQQQSSSAGTAGEKGTGLGLYLVQELLQKINATLEVKSEKGQGSIFSIVIPA